MKMPLAVDSTLFAPCGMNCLLCIAFLRLKKPCKGCLVPDANKPKHCQTCSIKACCIEKGIVLCKDCKLFPCARIKRLDKRYQEKYEAGLIQNSQILQEQGMDAFLQQQQQEWTCKHCGGVVCVHDKICSDCKKLRD